jgi:hypothetical protein
MYLSNTCPAQSTIPVHHVSISSRLISGFETVSVHYMIKITSIYLDLNLYVHLI